MTLKRKLVLVGAGALVLAAAGSAVAASGRHGHTDKSAVSAVRWTSAGGHRGFGVGFGGADDLSAAATYLGITADALKADLQSGKTLAQVADGTSGKSSAGLVAALVADGKGKLDAAVTAGKLTSAQEQTALAGLQQRVTDLVNGTRPSFPGLGMGFGFGGLGSMGLSAAATYLGITADVLKADLQSGKTLAQVADGTSGKSSAGLIAALVADGKAKLDAAVSAGKLASAQEQMLLAGLQKLATAFVNGARPSIPVPGPGMGFGFGFRGRGAGHGVSSGGGNA